MVALSGIFFRALQFCQLLANRQGLLQGLDLLLQLLRLLVERFLRWIGRC